MDHNPNIKRVNPSNEAIDFFVSYQANESLRFYIGPGWIFHTDDTYYFKPFYVEYGGDATFFGYKRLLSQDIWYVFCCSLLEKLANLRLEFRRDLHVRLRME